VRKAAGCSRSVGTQADKATIGMIDAGRALEFETKDLLYPDKLNNARFESHQRYLIASEELKARGTTRHGLDIRLLART
jgi:hypothetical protein